MGVLATTIHPVLVQPSAITDHLQAKDAAPVQAPGSTTSFASRNETFRSSTMPEYYAEQSPVDASRPYDPIDAGLLDETQASMQLTNSGIRSPNNSPSSSWTPRVTSKHYVASSLSCSCPSWPRPHIGNLSYSVRSPRSSETEWEITSVPARCKVWKFFRAC
jgi:hypothetical protein